MNSSGTRNWKSSLRYVVGLAGIAFAVHVMLPQVKELPDAVHRAETGSVWWIMAAAAISLAVCAGGAISLQGSLEQAIPIVPAAQTQLAIAFAGLMAP